MEGFEDPSGSEGAAPPSATGTGVLAPLMGMEHDYEGGAAIAKQQLKKYTSFPKGIPLIGGWSLPAAMVPETLPELAIWPALAATGLIQEAILPKAAMKTARYEQQLVRRLARPLVPAIASSGTAAVTGKDPNQAFGEGAFTGLVSGAHDAAANWLISREGSPYITKYLNRISKNVGAGLRAKLPNLFNGVPLESGTSLLNAFRQPFESLPWVRSVIARYPNPRSMPVGVRNTLNGLKEIYSVLGEFFTEPDNYTPDGSVPDPRKMQEFILKKGPTVGQRWVGVFDQIIRDLYGLKPGEKTEMTGFSVMPEGGHMGSRLHTVPTSENHLTPLNIIMHYGFGKPGKFAGLVDELTPSWVKNLNRSLYFNRLLHGALPPGPAVGDEDQEQSTSENTSMGEGPKGK